MRDRHDLGAEPSGEPGAYVSPRLRIAFQDLFAQAQERSRVALAPDVGEPIVRRLGQRWYERLDLALADRLPVRPCRQLLHLARELLRVVPDQLEQRGARLGLRLRAVELELLRNPARQALLHDLVRQHLARLCAGPRQRRVLLQLLGDEREHRSGRRGREVGLDRLHVGDLPAVREPFVRVPAAVDALDDDEPGVAEEAADVAERGRVFSRHLLRRDQLHSLGLEVAPEPSERRLDLRAVAPGEQVDGLQVGRLGHASTLLNAPSGQSAAARPIRPRPARPRRFGRG